MQVNTIARLTRVTPDKAEKLTVFIHECVVDTTMTQDVDNALSMYDYAESVCESVANEDVTAAAERLRNVAINRLEVLAGFVFEVEPEAPTSERDESFVQPWEVAALQGDACSQ